MASQNFDTWVSGLTAATAVGTSDVLPIIQGGATKKLPANILSFLGTSCESQGASPSASATVNTAAIQAALNITGEVTLTTPGICSTNGTLSLLSNTQLQLGSATRIKQAASTNLMMALNANAQSAEQTVTITVAVSAQSQEYIATVIFPLAHGIPVGGYVCIKGDTSYTHNGNWEVFSVPSSTTLTYLLGEGATAPGSGTGTITAAPGDGNITLEGGIWDWNAQNQNTSTDYNRNAICLNRVLNSEIRNITAKDVRKCVVQLSNCSNSGVRDLHADTDSNGVNIYGQCLDGYAERITGTYGDDVVAALPTESTGYTSQLLPSGDQVGDIKGFTVRDIKPKRAKGNVLAIYAQSGYVYQGIEAYNLEATDSARAAVQIANTIDSTTKLVNDVSVKGIRGIYSHALVAIQGLSTGILTVNKLLVEDCYPDPNTPLNTDTASAFSIMQSVVKDFTINGLYATFFITNAQQYAVYFQDANSHSDCIRIQNWRLSTTGTTNSVNLLANSGGAMGTVYIEDGVIDGVGSLLAGSFPSGQVFFISRVVAEGSAQNLLGLDNTNATFFFSDCVVNAVSQGHPFNLYGSSNAYTINLYIKNLKHSLTEILLNVSGTGQVVNIFGDATAKTDITKLGKAPGQTAWHNGASTAGTITANEMCICDHAGTWHQMSVPTNTY